MTKSAGKLDKIESTLMQPKAKAPQDVRYPIQLNDKMAGLGSNISSSVKTNQKCLCSL
jgi:hypothetical protein